MYVCLYVCMYVCMYAYLDYLAMLTRKDDAFVIQCCELERGVSSTINSKGVEDKEESFF